MKRLFIFAWPKLLALVSFAIMWCLLKLVGQAIYPVIRPDVSLAVQAAEKAGLPVFRWCMLPSLGFATLLIAGVVIGCSLHVFRIWAADWRKARQRGRCGE